MSRWRRPFELLIPAPPDVVLAAASAVDRSQLHDGHGWLTPGYGLEVEVEEGGIVAEVWMPRGRSSYHGPKLRASVESRGSATLLVGELTWWRLATTFAIIPALIVAAICGGLWGAGKRPDEVTFSHFFFWGSAAVLAALWVAGTRAQPRRMAKDEAQLKHALLRDLVQYYGG